MVFKSLSLLFLGVGIFVIVQVVMPVLYFKVWEWTFYERDSILVDPYPNNGEVLGVSVENVGNFPAIISSSSRKTLSPYRDFKLSIPKLDLDWPRVIVDSNNFENNLAHLPGSPLPGERGNIFITGHSTLTQLYKENNYKAVFSKLPEVKPGDEIILEALGQEFKYTVLGLKIVDPKDTSVVRPPDTNGRYLSLMTCVPPGLNTKRLIVLAKLQNN